MQVIGNEWDGILSDEYVKPYFSALLAQVEKEYSSEKVYPPKDKIFRALYAVPYSEVKAVILGQDPYHGEGQANGMAFAVASDRQMPPSLVNIFKEIYSETGERPNGSTLTGWAKQGVLLLNTVLTVRDGQPQSHSGIGWQTFTDAVIEKLALRKNPLVFILWGANAANKKRFIGPPHLVLESAHPSPLSAHRGFFGCGHFLKANEFLTQNGLAPINWAMADYEETAPYYTHSGTIRRV